MKFKADTAYSICLSKCKYKLICFIKQCRKKTKPTHTHTYTHTHSYLEGLIPPLLSIFNCFLCYLAAPSQF